MGGKTGGEDQLTGCQGRGRGMGQLGSGQDVAPKGILLLPCFPIQVLPPHFCHPVRIHSVLQFISQSPAELLLPRSLCRHPQSILNTHPSPLTLRRSDGAYWNGGLGTIAGLLQTNTVTAGQGRRCWFKPALGIRGKSVPSRGNKKHRIPKFGVRNRKVSAAGTSPFEGVWHLMNLEVQSALAWTVGHVVCYQNGCLFQFIVFVLQPLLPFHFQVSRVAQ